MSSFPAPTNPTSEEQASLWAARLDGSVLSASDRLILDEWLASHPDHRTLLSRYCQFSADLEQQMPLLEGIKELSAEVSPSLATAQPYPWSRWPLMASVALTAAAAVGVVVWLARPDTRIELLATPAAQRQSLTLADGSRLELNARTSLQAEIGPKVRHVRLTRGEAFFTVQKDPTRPFIVETPAGSVRVTGTQFNVRAETAAALEVTVAEGAVQVQPEAADGSPAAPVQLGVGDKLSANSGQVSVLTLSRAALGEALAWRQGQIVSRGAPLREALARFAHYHGREITAEAAAGELPLGGRYSLDDLEGFLTGLQDTLHVRVTHRPNGTVQVNLPGAR